MQYQLKLKDGTEVNLRFSMYFLNRMCQLSRVGLTELMGYMAGISENLEIMAQILAAAMEAEAAANRNPVKFTAIDGFDVMDKMPNFLQSDTIWLEMVNKIRDCIMPEGLPKEAPAKKKAGGKRLTSRTSST